MNYKTTLLLAALAITGGVTWFLVERWGPAEHQSEAIETIEKGITKENLTSITIQRGQSIIALLFHHLAHLFPDTGRVVPQPFVLSRQSRHNLEQCPQSLDFSFCLVQLVGGFGNITIGELQCSTITFDLVGGFRSDAIAIVT
jgi:hypothetical protein